MRETPRVFTLTPTRDWVIVRKIESPLAPSSPIYRVNRDPNGPEYGIVLKIGPLVCPPDQIPEICEGDMVLLGAGVGDAVQFGEETVHFIQWPRADIKAVITGGA